ncbi:MAG: hypothetical protein IPH77_03295 [Ignavibacteria bacterium]|nr:hypothetical protein [Ignavibacteria bacterium]
MTDSDFTGGKRTALPRQQTLPSNDGLRYDLLTEQRKYYLPAFCISRRMETGRR